MLGEGYLNTRDSLIDLIRYTRALAKRSNTPLEEGEDALEDSLTTPFRFIVIGDAGTGKSSFLEVLTGASLAKVNLVSPSVSIIRDAGYRVFDEAEDACAKHYVTKIKGYEFVEVQGYAQLDAQQHSALQHLIEGADFVFWLFSAENPWSAAIWDSLEKDYHLAAMKSALILHQVDRRAPNDIPMLLGHMKELCKKRVERELPMFATSVEEGSDMADCVELVSRSLDRSIDRRRQLRNVYKQTYSLLRRTEENVDDRSRNLAGDQEYLQSIEAQIDRVREQEVRRVMENMSQLSKLLSSQIKRVMRYTSLRTGVVASHISLFGKGDIAAKVEQFLIEKVSAEAEAYAEKEGEKMREQCREKWQEMRPHLEERLSIDVGDFNEKSFDSQQEIFVEGMTKAVGQTMVSLKLRRFLDALVVRRYLVMRKLLKLALLLISVGACVGLFSSKVLGLLPLCLVGLGGGIFLLSVFYGRRTGSQVNHSFAESLEDAVPALRKGLREGYIDRVRAFYNGFTPMFESMRRHVSDAKAELLPQQKVAGQLFLRLKALEQEI